MERWNSNHPIAACVRQRGKASKLMEAELSDLTGVELRFVRNIEQGKPNFMIQFLGSTMKPQLITNWASYSINCFFFNTPCYFLKIL